MSEKITCPVTLGEYEIIMDNREKEHKCNCNGKCKVCKCKEKEEKNLYNLFTETQKQIVQAVCDDMGIKLDDCVIIKPPDNERYLPQVVLTYLDRIIALPITTEDVKSR